MARSTHTVRIEMDVYKKILALHGIQRIAGVKDYVTRAVREQLKRDGLDEIAEQALRLRADAPDTPAASSTDHSGDDAY